MTAPPPDATIAQVLIKLGEMSAQLAAMTEQLKTIPDHEARLRALERFRFTLAGAVIAVSGVSAAAATWIGNLVHH